MQTDQLIFSPYQQEVLADTLVDRRVDALSATLGVSGFDASTSRRSVLPAAPAMISRGLAHSASVGMLSGCRSARGSALPSLKGALEREVPEEEARRKFEELNTMII